jgi:hypothetical protein
MVLFSALPTNLGNRSNRFPHSHRHDDDEDELNILKTRPAKRYAFRGQGQLMPYYDDLIAEFFPEKIDW